jgi:hypothetical protein
MCLVWYDIGVWIQCQQVLTDNYDFRSYRPHINNNRVILDQSFVLTKPSTPSIMKYRGCIPVYTFVWIPYPPAAYASE